MNLGEFDILNSINTIKFHFLSLSSSMLKPCVTEALSEELFVIVEFSSLLDLRLQVRLSIDVDAATGYLGITFVSGRLNLGKFIPTEAACSASSTRVVVNL